MTYRPAPDESGPRIMALRYLLWRLEYEAWEESPIDEGRDEPLCPVTDADLPVLLTGLARMAFGDRQALAPPQVDVADQEQVTKFVRDTMKDELGVLERTADRAARLARFSVATDGGPETA